MDSLLFSSFPQMHTTNVFSGSSYSSCLSEKFHRSKINLAHYAKIIVVIHSVNLSSRGMPTRVQSRRVESRRSSQSRLHSQQLDHRWYCSARHGRRRTTPRVHPDIKATHYQLLMIDIKKLLGFFFFSSPYHVHYIYYQ